MEAWARFVNPHLKVVRIASVQDNSTTTSQAKKPSKSSSLSY